MAPTPPPTPASPAPPASGGPNLKRIVLIATGALIGIVLLVLIVALLLAGGDVTTMAPIIRVVRDLVIIFLALEGILIILGLAVLILQVARLINLLQNEVQPVLKDTRETLHSARGTVEFVGDTVTGPIVKAGAFVAGTTSLISSLGGIRKAIRRTAAGVEDATDGA